MSKFSQKLLSDMYERNVHFSKILHIPTLTAASNLRVSDDFQEFLEAASYDHQSNELLKQCAALGPTLEQIRNNVDIKNHAQEVARDLYSEAVDFEFLIQLEIRFPYNFKFDENGEYRTNSLSQDYLVTWVIAKDMVDATNIAIQKAQNIWETECQNAKKEQGLVA